MRVNFKLGPEDLVKVAQYEVLGDDSKRDVRPGRDDRNARPLASRIRIHKHKQPSIVPPGTACAFFSISRHFVPGYFHHVPPGRFFA
jgi:hypothetical protein